MKSEDKLREDILKKKGFSILRFWNDDVLLRTEDVTEQVYNVVQK